MNVSEKGAAPKHGAASVEVVGRARSYSQLPGCCDKGQRKPEPDEGKVLGTECRLATEAKGQVLRKRGAVQLCTDESSQDTHGRGCVVEVGYATRGKATERGWGGSCEERHVQRAR